MSDKNVVLIFPDTREGREYIANLEARLAKMDRLMSGIVSTMQDISGFISSQAVLNNNLTNNNILCVNMLQAVIHDIKKIATDKGNANDNALS